MGVQRSDASEPRQKKLGARASTIKAQAYDYYYYYYMISFDKPMGRP